MYLWVPNWQVMQAVVQTSAQSSMQPKRKIVKNQTRYEGRRQWDTIKKTLERRKDEGRVDAANWHELPCSVATSRSGSCVAMLEASIHLTTPNLPRSRGIIPRMYPDIFFIIVCGLDDTLITLMTLHGCLSGWQQMRNCRQDTLRC